MTRQQINVRIGDTTRSKLDWLTRCYGSQTQAFVAAVDRLYISERRIMEQNQQASELWDAFAPEADPEGIATLDTEILTRQISELRANDCDKWQHLSDREIAVIIQTYAGADWSDNA